MIDPHYNTPMPDGTVRYWTQEEIDKRKAEEEEAKKPKPKKPTEAAADEFIALPLSEQLKPENAIPFLMAFFYTQIGKPEMLPLIVEAAQPSTEAQPTKDKIKERLENGG